jgi:CHAT domain-containing protein
MGYLYFTLGQKEKATEFFNQGLQLCRSVGDRLCEATVLRGLGSINKSSGQYEKSLQYLSEARKLFQSCGERDREAIVLHQLADVNQALGNLDEAREQLEEAILIKESVRANVASQELRDSFFVSAQNSFALYIDVLMQLHQKYPDQHYDAAALRANERARARGLLELLAQANVVIRQGVSPELLGRERSLQQQLNKTAARARTPDDPNTKQSDRELEELSARLREVRAQIRVDSPRYAALTQPQPLSSNEIGQLLDDNTVLLEFGLGKKQSWLWAVTRNGVATYQLPAGDKIESTSRKVYTLLTARRPEPNLTESEQLKRIAAADSALQSEIGVLSKMLFDPVAETLRTEWKEKRLVIVGSGALEILPFAVLRNPGDPLPLIANHEIVNLPSASVLSIIRQESAGRTPPTKMVAVLADPVFETNDPRLRVASGRAVSNQHPQPAGLPASTNGADSPLQRSIRSMNQGSLSRLPFSREEANAISALVSPTSVLKATDFRANRERATSGELSNYQIIHFATHALLNSEHPELSGLVLSLVDENGQPQDGFLRVNELYNMRLPANLVVLSACQTGLGKEIRGEGLIGLTRGFMYAGAQRVVASLWQVDDLATAQLMKEFYRGMLKDKLPPAAALRAAQLSMIKDKRWESPYFWAAFTIQGEWK